MGRKSRNKGARAEREFAKLTGGRRVPLSGAAEGFPGDVQAKGLLWEVKRRKQAWGQLYEWLEGVDALAIRADHKDWLVVIPLERFLAMMERKKGGARNEARQ